MILNDDNGNVDFFGRINLRPQDPVFDIDMLVEGADLVKLNLFKSDSVAQLDLNLHASFSGKEIDDFQGQLWIENSSFRNSRGEIPLRELSLEVGENFSGKKIVLVSEYVDGRINGDIYLDDLFGQLASVGGRFLPLNLNNIEINESRLNNFSFNINFKNPRPISEVLTPSFVFKENSQFSGFFKYGGKELDIEGNSPQFLANRKQFTDLRFRIRAVENDLELTANLDKIQLDLNNVFNDISLKAIMLPDLMETSLSWSDKDSLKHLCEINPLISFEPGKGTLPKMIIELPNTTVFFKEKQWEIGDSHFEIDKNFFSVRDLDFTSQDEKVMIHGVVSDFFGDTLELQFNSLDMGIINQISSGDKFDMAGLIDGEAKIFDFYSGGLFLADITINDFAINGEEIGVTEVKSRRAQDSDDVLINVLTKRGDISTLQMDGKYSPKTDNLDFLFKLDKLKLNIFDPFLYPVLSDVNGIASGDVSISGTRKKPVLDGMINVQKGKLTVDYLNTKLSFTHPIIVKENAFLIDGLVARDSLGNQAIVNGGIRHKNFQDLRLDFNIQASDLLLMDTKEIDGNGYWGQIFGTGLVRINGPMDKINIDVSARTSGNSMFAIPISERGSAREFDFISYVVHEVPDKDPDLLSFSLGTGKQGYNVQTNKLQIKLDIDVTPQAEVFLIFDAQVGDVLRGRGSGNLQLNINDIGLFTLNGDYNIDEGEYLFTLQNMPIKRFAIEPGSSINWTGPVDEAQLDIDAVYNTKAALYDLLLEESDELTERVPVTCHLLMKGILKSPDLSFAINLPPNSDDMARSQLESLTEDELNKQLFSLLILNRFQPLPGLNSTASTRNYGSAGLATTTSVLSSQLNYWLSQISNDFDIGFNYRPGDQITSDEVEVALKTQIFNDRMSINLNGNVDVRSTQGETNQLVGDVEVEYKITPSGKVRVKAFNRSNDRLIYEYSPYTQGLGLFFREEFDTLGDLFKKYWQGIAGKGKTGNQ